MIQPAFKRAQYEHSVFANEQPFFARGSECHGSLALSSISFLRAAGLPILHVQVAALAFDLTFRLVLLTLPGVLLVHLSKIYSRLPFGACNRNM